MEDEYLFEYEFLNHGYNSEHYHLLFKTLEGNQLADAIHAGDVVRLTRMIDECRDRNIDLNAFRNNVDQTLAFRAVYLDYPQILRILLERGIDVNVIDARNNTILHSASFWGLRECVEIILEAGADETISKKERGIEFTSLDYARMRGYDEIVKLLEEYTIENSALDVKEPSDEFMTES